MARKPKKPKKLRYPKMPKKSASLQTLKNYERRCTEVDKKNAHRASEYNRKISEISQAHSLYERLRNKKSHGAKEYRLKVA